MALLFNSRLALLALASASPLFGADNILTSAEKAQGWKLLFDGKSTEGWVEVTGKPVPAVSWTIDQGCLKTVITPGGAQDIRTTGSFRSFDLEFDWKVLADGNSGVKYLLQHIDEWNNAQGHQARARGFEYQIADNAGPDAKTPSRSAASLYSAIAPMPPTNPKIGEFHHARILVRGDHFEHWLDGVRVVSFELPDAPAQKIIAGLRKKGEGPDTPVQRQTPISLQNHGTEAWFKNLKIRRLE